jgi:tRNA nucleotidyltransferase (CCA-adding enzyme)
MKPRLSMPPHVNTIAELLLAAGLPCYAVGGSVRNALLGLPATDYDICGPATVEEVMRVLPEGGRVSYGNVYGRMGTMQLHADGGIAEYTTFRRDSYDGGHRPERVEFVRTLDEDAFRRDFTVNALYFDLSSGETRDPTGGLADLERRVLRATGADPAVIMRDDGLRVLRMVRFAAQLRMAIDPATYAAADARLLLDIAAERLRAELALILLSDARYDLPGERNALENALRQLDDLGAMNILLPGMRLDAKACAAVPADLVLRLAALLRENGHDEVKACLEHLRFPTRVAREAALLVGDLAHAPLDSYRLLRKGYAHARSLAALEPALAPLLSDLCRRGAPDSLSALALSGADVVAELGGSSPAVGVILTTLWRHAIDHPEHNTKARLLRVLHEVMIEKETTV